MCKLFYIATGEEALADVMDQRTIGLLIQRTDPSQSVIVAGHRDDLLNEVLGPETVRELSFETANWEAEVMETRGQRSPISGTDLSDLTRRLESAVRSVAD